MLLLFGEPTTVVVVPPEPFTSSEPWSTYVPNFLVLCSTVEPVILQSGAVHASSTQSVSVQLAIDGFSQNMSFGVARTDILGCRGSTLRDLIETRESLGADEVFRVDAPVKSAVNLNSLDVVLTTLPVLLNAEILKDPPLAFALLDVPEATTT